MKLHPFRCRGSLALGTSMLFVLGGPLAACDRSADLEPAPAVAATHRYEVRGRVLGVQTPVGGLERLSIDHEAIPEFRDLDTDEVVGMPAMTMPFPLAAGLPVPELGADVAFTLLVDGGDHGGLPYVIESVRPAEDADPAR